MFLYIVFIFLKLNKIIIIFCNNVDDDNKNKIR